MTCEVCGRSKGSRTPRCLRCAERTRDRMLPAPLPGRYLVVDPGRRYGAAIVQAGAAACDWPLHVLEATEGEVWSRSPEQVVTRARAEGCEALILEAPGLGPSMPPATTLGLGEARGVWLWLWRTSASRVAGGITQHGRSVIVDIPAMTWRAGVLSAVQRGKDEWKAAAAAHCRSVLGVEAAGNEIPDALCLAHYALHSLDLADAVGVRRLTALGWQEPRGCWVDGRWRGGGEP